MTDSREGSRDRTILEELAAGGLDKLFEDEEVCAYLKQGLVEAGCRPPFHIVLFTLFKKGVLLGWSFGGQSLRSRLLSLIARNDALSRWLDGIASICRECDDKNRLKNVMLDHLRGTIDHARLPRIDDATEGDVLAMLYTKSRFDAQDERLEEITTLLQDQLADRSGDAITPYLGWSIGGTATLADSIRYNSGLYDFVARDAELDLLGRFCGDVSGAGPRNRFSWLLLTGPGGEGKTRLALEFTTRHIGANWRAGRLSLADLQRFRHAEWLPAAPTMIVIDYPAQSPGDVHALLASLARRHRAFDWPVRVLLLEREAEGTWFERGFPRSGDGAAIRDRAFGASRASTASGTAIGPIAADAIIALMRRRFEREGLEPPEDRLLVTAAWSVDRRAMRTAEGLRPLPRPLFAAAVAELMIEAVRHGQALNADWITQLERETVLSDIVARDRLQHWAPRVSDARDLARHEHLIALATLVGGLHRSDLRRLHTTHPALGRLVPTSGRTEDRPLNEDLLRAAGGYENGRVGPLEPDLLGEHFLLDRLTTIDEDEGESIRRDLCAAALELGGTSAISCAARTATDFPERASALGWLLPSLDASRIALEGAAKLAVELTGTLGWRAIDAAEWLKALNGAEPNDQVFALRAAQAAFNLANAAGAIGDWERLADTFAWIDRLRARFPTDGELALREAKAALNTTGHRAVEGDLTLLNAMLQRLRRLRHSFPADTGIASLAAQCTFNSANWAMEVRAWRRFDEMLALIDDIRSDFTNDAEIALQEAKAAANLVSHLSETMDWERAGAMLDRIDRLRSAFPGDAEIIFRECNTALVLGSMVQDLPSEMMPVALRLARSVITEGLRSRRFIDIRIVELLAIGFIGSVNQAIDRGVAFPGGEPLALIKHLLELGYDQELSELHSALTRIGIDWSQVPAPDLGTTDR